MDYDKRLFYQLQDDPLAKQGVMQFVGVLTPFEAMLVKDKGFFHYFSGAGISSQAGRHDNGSMNVRDVTSIARDIIPLIGPNIADADTGFGNAETIERMVRDYSAYGIQGFHIEDQPFDKKVCGHVPGKHVILSDEMKERLEIALETREECGSDIVVMARVDAFGAVNVEQEYEEAVKRGQAYVAAGVHGIFIEKVPTVDDLINYRRDVPDTPLLYNMTEGKKSPAVTPEQLQEIGVKMMIYPVTMFRAAAQAMMDVLAEIKANGNQVESEDAGRIASRKDVTALITKFKGP